MRLFIGLPLPETIQERLKAAWAQVPGNPAEERPMRSSFWHVTLAFLDEVDEESLEPLRQIVEKAIVHPPGGTFHIKSFQAFPLRKPSRIVAVAEPEQKREWERFVRDLRDMVSLVAPNVDRKPWLPHIPITRGTKGTSLIQWAAPFPEITWQPTDIAIIKSTLGPTGSKYTNLHVFPLDI